MIHRADHEKDFTIISNAALHDNNISIEARGLLCLLLSNSDGWAVSVDSIMQQAGIGRKKAMRLTKELQAAGYIVQTRTRSEAGQFAACLWSVYEEKTGEDLTTVPQCDTVALWQHGTTVPKNGTAAKRHCRKRTLTSTKYKQVPNINKDEEENIKVSNKTIKEVINKEEEKPKKPDIKQIIAEYAGEDTELKEALGAWLEVRKGKRAPATAKAINLNLKKLEAYAQAAGISRTEYVNEITRRGWAAFYPIKAERQEIPTQSPINWQDIARKAGGIE